MDSMEDDLMDSMDGVLFKLSKDSASIAKYEICCGFLGGHTVEGLTVELANGAALPCDYEITIKNTNTGRVITVFNLLQSQRNSATLMNRLEPVLLCFNYKTPSTLDTIAANIKTLLENSGLMYAENIKGWGGMDLDSRIFEKDPNGMHRGILFHLTEMNRWSMVGRPGSRCVFLENDDANNRIKCVSVEFLFPSKVLRYRFFEKRSDLLPISLTGLQYIDLETITSSDENHILTKCLQTIKSKANVRIPDGHIQWYIKGSDYLRLTGIKSILHIYERIPGKSEYTFFDIGNMVYYAIHERNSAGPASADLAFSMIEYFSMLMDRQVEKWKFIKKIMQFRGKICNLSETDKDIWSSVIRLIVPGIDDGKIQTISSFLLGNVDVPDIPVTLLGENKIIDFNHVNGRLRKSNIRWRGGQNDEWFIYIIILPETNQESIANYSVSDHLNDDNVKGDRPSSLLSKMDSRNDQFTSTLRVLNRVLDTASTGL